MIGDLAARLLRLTLAALLALGCAGNNHFVDAAPVWQVDDRRSISEPTVRDYDPALYFANIFVVDRLDRTLAMLPRKPAGNVNAIEEVPDSSWFQNRIGLRSMSPAEVARGVDAGGPPQPPLTIRSGKVGGGNPGFIASDATGRRFLIKLDTAANPELQTAAGVIVNRIFWAIGYNVPSDHVIGFRKSDLRFASDASYSDSRLRKRPLTWRQIDAVLGSGPPPLAGVYRAFASQLLDGKPMGGFAPAGVRTDDPNDRVPHERRRELRGLRVFAAWVGHTDMKEDNTLDTYVTEGGQRYLKHYLLDFGEALDGHAAEKGRREDGFEHFVDWEAQTRAALSVGLWKRPWEDVKPTRWASVGSFSAHAFDPRRWREAYPFWPFAEMDAADAYWAAKLVQRFDRPMLEAVIAEGHYSDPAAAHYLVDTLLERRDAIGRAFLDAVTPLDDFELDARRLCMNDVAVRYGFAESGQVDFLTRSGVGTSLKQQPDGRLCVSIPKSRGYTVYRMRVRRADGPRPAMELHFQSGPDAHVIGLIRVEN